MTVPPESFDHSPNIPAHCQALAPRRSNTFRCPIPCIQSAPAAHSATVSRSCRTPASGGSN